MNEPPFFPSPRPLVWPDIIEVLQTYLKEFDAEIYLVGGAVRDVYLNRPLKDIDLAVSMNGCPVARHLANQIEGVYYPLDTSRGVGRAIVVWQGKTIVIDVAQYRADTIIDDLQLRDFTLNAMAVDLHGNLQTILDPMGGIADLRERLLRRCTARSIADDPVRALRAIRASVEFQLRIEPETQQDIRSHGKDLPQMSAERVRDELFSLLTGNSVGQSMAIMERLGLLEHILPELAQLKGLTQATPHVHDAWQHTLATMNYLNKITRVVQHKHDDNLTANFHLGTIVFVFGKLNSIIAPTLEQVWANDRPHRTLLLLAALLHDAGKPATCTQTDTGQIRFIGHEQVSERIAASYGESLKLSNAEKRRLMDIVRHHMRPLNLFNEALSTGEQVARRAIYRFWRDTGDAGVDICLLSMADFLATYESTLNNEQWLQFLDLIRRLLDFRYSDQDLMPPSRTILNGQELIEYFDLTAGPLIGRLLEVIREAQALGEIKTREEAIDLVQSMVSDSTTFSSTSSDSG